MRYVRVPVDRIGVVIGPDGKNKRFLERRTGCRLNVDSETGEIEIDDHEAADPLMPIKMEDIVRALGRGFSPEHAARLLRDDVYLTIFDVHDYVGKKPKAVQRMVGRVVGTEGRTRRLLEELTGSFVAVQGHTVGLIADIDGTEVAKQAVDLLLSGSEHASVYRFLEGKRRQRRMRRREF